MAFCVLRICSTSYEDLIQQREGSVETKTLERLIGKKCRMTLEMRHVGLKWWKWNIWDAYFMQNEEWDVIVRALDGPFLVVGDTTDKPGLTWLAISRIFWIEPLEEV
jgi:hypothetical protein